MLRARSALVLCGVVVFASVSAVAVTAWRTTASSQAQLGAVAATATSPPDVVATSVGSATRPPSTAVPAGPPPEPPPVVPVKTVLAAAEGAAAPGMRLGVAVLDVTTGEAVSGRYGTRPFMAASLAKLLLVVDILDRRAVGEPIPDLDLIGRALRRSDDGAMNVLWTRYGGPAAVTRVAARLGLATTRTPAEPNLWGNAVVSAADLVRIYQYILRTMPAEHRDLIVGALSTAQPTGTDGFDQFFGLLSNGASGQVYAKQAWVPYRPAGYLLHSTGVVHDARTGHDYAIALLSIQSYVSNRTAGDRLSAVAGPVLRTLGGSI